MARVEPLLESAGSALEDLGDELGVSWEYISAHVITQQQQQQQQPLQHVV